ncbi:MAG: peptide-methionine (S)-S-oxide reductase MsrA [Desulfobacterales bacterium]
MVLVTFILVSLQGGIKGRSDDSPSERSGNRELKRAVLAGGCFWCMEADFEKRKGVRSVVSGYAGGTGENPTYENYAEKGYIEAVRITYDPATVTYEELLDFFWVRIDPVDDKGQFCDRGHEYTSAVFYVNNRQKQLAEESKTVLANSGVLKRPVATKILPSDNFFPAEKYHQQYYEKHWIRYKFYRLTCGRDSRLDELWGGAEMLKDVLKKK